VTPYFPLDTLRAIIGGASGLDVPRLHLEDREQAEDFLDAYGFPWSSRSCRADVEDLRREALAFLSDHLLEPDERVPWRVSHQDDVPELLLLASRPDDEDQPWSCALLRVMHTLAHAHSHLGERYGTDIRRQILDRFRPHLHPDPEHATALGDVPLVAFEMKQAKTRASTVFKLLHKPENVAADIFDHVGVRFVTPTRFDALRVVRYLRLNNVIMFANVKPTRSRNSLVDIEAIADELAALGPDDIEAMRGRALPHPPMPPHDNPFSSIAYRSIQFTCRQTIRSRSVRFFFPFEVQIMDLESWEDSRSGLASHAEYKARQREAVRRRVLGPLA
jgi:uncharacterized protein (TIGR04562 family)